MSQHFLLTAKARSLSLRTIFADGEGKAYQTFRQLRWPQTDGAPICCHCGSLTAYEIASRRRFECADCGKQYSVTSGTIFHSRKKSYTDLLAAICIIMNAAKGVSALQLARDLNCQHKTAFVLAHKIRQSLAAETKKSSLTGDVEIDGSVFWWSHPPRQSERKQNRSPSCSKPNRQASRRDCARGSAKAERSRSLVRMSQRALQSRSRSLPRVARSSPMKPPTGTCCQPPTIRSGSIIRWPIA